MSRVERVEHGRAGTGQRLLRGVLCIGSFLALYLAGCSTNHQTPDSKLLTQKPLSAPGRMERSTPDVKIPAIHFGLDSSELSPEAKTDIGQAVEIMKKQPKLYATIQGHTCSRGAPEHNRALSGRRAAIVMKHMIDAGIAANRLGAVSMGAGSPAVPNITEAQKSLNRRVEIHLYSWKDAKPAKGRR